MPEIEGDVDMVEGNEMYPTGYRGRIQSEFVEHPRADTAEVRNASRMCFDYTKTWECHNDDMDLEDHMKPAKDGDGEVAVMCPGCDPEEVFFEMYEGFYGTGENTLVKDVDYRTKTCPECGSPGRTTDVGTVCQDDSCGVMIDDEQRMVPEDGFNDRVSGVDSGFPALRESQLAASTEEER